MKEAAQLDELNLFGKKPNTSAAKKPINYDEIRRIATKTGGTQQQVYRSPEEYYAKINTGKTKEPVKEFAPPGGDDNGPDEEAILRQLASQWWRGDADPKAERTLAAMGWEIGQDESGDDDAGVFLVRPGDVNGDSYIAFPQSELELDEGQTSDMRNFFSTQQPLNPAPIQPGNTGPTIARVTRQGESMAEVTTKDELEELANTSLKVKEPKDFVNTNDRKQVTYKVMRFKSGKDTYLINFTVKGAPAFGKKQNWNAVNVAFGVREEQDDYSFGDEINTDLTAKNKNQFIIYSTVINAVRKFITEYNTEIDEIIMQGAGERQVMMYQRFFRVASKYFPGWHYDGKHSLVRDVPRLKTKKIKKEGVAEGQLELNTPDPVVVIQDKNGKILDKVNLSIAAKKYNLGQPDNVKKQLAHQNYTTIGNYVVVSPMSGQPQDNTTQGVLEDYLPEK